MLNLAETTRLQSPVELQEGFARLSRGQYFREASLDVTLGVLTEAAGQVAGVERVGIWALVGQDELRCLDLFEQASGRHSSGASFARARYPACFAALSAGGAVVADDPYIHPATSELGADYLPSHDIAALLGVPIHIRGELQGMLCLEQVGARRPWTAMHRLFAQAVANLVTLALVEHEAGEARRQAQSANLRLRAVFDAARDAMVLADSDSGVILDANREAEKLFACPKVRLIGRHRRQLLAPGEEERCGRDLFLGLREGGGRTLRTAVLQGDGAEAGVEVSAEVADLSGGRCLALVTFRRAG